MTSRMYKTILSPAADGKGRSEDEQSALEAEMSATRGQPVRHTRGKAEGINGIGLVRGGERVSEPPKMRVCLSKRGMAKAQEGAKGRRQRGLNGEEKTKRMDAKGEERARVVETT